MRIDSSGNVGIGVVPKSGQYSGYNHLQVGESATLSSNDTNSDTNITSLTQNAYLDATASNWKYLHSDEASRYQQYNGIHYFSSASSGTADGNISFTEKLKIDSDGLKFNGDTAAANALDDYEEGSFTPRLGGTSNPGSYYVTGTGTYIKIGRQVTVSIRFNGVDLDNSASGTVQIFNMPFTGGHRPSNGACGITTDVEYYAVPFDTGHLPSFFLGNNSTIWYGLLSRSNSTWADFPVSDFHSSGLYMMFAGTYFTDS
jgi:hypothetical protein